MSDFCYQCSKDLTDFLNHKDDLAGLVTRDQSKSGMYAEALCERCGPTFVDSEGYCKSKDCLEKHGDY